MASIYNSNKTGVMARYNAALTTLVIDGVVAYGYKSGGNMVQITWDNDNVTVETDAQGTSVSSTNNKDSATVTVNLNQASPLNAKLTELWNNKTEFSIDCTNSTEHWWSNYAYVSKPADIADGDTAGERAWTIHLLNGNLESLISE